LGGFDFLGRGFGSGNKHSNISKTYKTEEEAKATVAYYEAKGTPCFYEKEGELYLVFREGDHKTLKSVNYSPADLKGILEG